jgi:hypothetical protein
MLQVEPIQNFNGFGTGKQPGEYFFSKGMQRSQFGIAPRWSVVSDATDFNLSNLALINWFSQGVFSGVSYVFGFSSSGYVYKSQVGSSSWTLAFNSAVNTHGNGLIFDQTNRLLYANDRYLGKYDGTTPTDNWKDFGASFEITDFRPMDTYEDWVVIGNKNQVALLNITDDSFNANALNLPSGFNIRCLKSGKNGVLIGANFNNRGALILWDAFSIRSIAPWIWRNKTIQSIVPIDDGWIVFTQDEILLTNGYSIQPLVSELPDYLLNDNSIINSMIPQGAEVRGNKLMFWGTGSRFNRQKAGIYILDLATKLFEFVPVSNGVTNGVTGGAILSDTVAATRVSYNTALPTTKFVGRLANTSPSQAVLITELLGQGDNEKVAEGVKLTYGVSPSQITTPNMTFNVSVKVCNARRNIFGRGLTMTSSSSAGILKIDGSIATANGINKAQVGDEVTILDGVNAGQVRHITAIGNPGTNTETWTLDSVLPNLTESGVSLNVSPFRLARTYTLSNLSELSELYFDIQDRMKGKKFFVKILLENLSSGFMPELKGGQFIFNDLGVKR